MKPEHAAQLSETVQTRAAEHRRLNYPEMHMEQHEMEALIQRYVRAYNGFDINGKVALLHPECRFENVSASERSNPDAPRAVSNWPDFRPDGRPRSATLAIRREDGGLIGT
jgi:secreted PhoX family phosphatase